MDLEKLISNITPEIHRALKTAVEIGKWPDGRALTDEQRALCMEAVIHYDQRFVQEQDRVGYIDRGSKAKGDSCDADSKDAGDDEAPLKWS